MFWIHLLSYSLSDCRVPTDLENLDKSGRKIVVRENFPAKSQGKIKFAVILVDYRVKVCHHYKRAHIYVINRFCIVSKCYVHYQY